VRTLLFSIITTRKILTLSNLLHAQSASGTLRPRSSSLHIYSVVRVTSEVQTMYRSAKRSGGLTVMSKKKTSALRNGREKTWRDTTEWNLITFHYLKHSSGKAFPPSVLEFQNRLVHDHISFSYRLLPLNFAPHIQKTQGIGVIATVQKPNRLAVQSIPSV
jgi:hypothetical protein